MAGLLLFVMAAASIAADTVGKRGPVDQAWLKAHREHLMPKAGQAGAATREWTSDRRLLLPTVNKTDTTKSDSQAYPAIVNMGGGKLFAAFLDESPVAGANQLSSFAYSTNDGASWTNGKAFPASAAGNGGTPAAAGNRLTQEVYVANTEWIIGAGETLPVYRSTDGGHTFNAPVNGAPGFVGTGEAQIDPSIAVDNFAGTGNVYVCWTDFFGTANNSYNTEVRFSRSTNHGATFTPANGPVAAPIAVGTGYCAVAVSPSHQVSVFYYRGRSVGVGANNKLYMRRSVDRGVTFGPEILVATLKSTERDLLTLASGKHTEMRPRVAINPVAAKPIIYVTYNDDPNPADPKDNSAVYYVYSTNGGGTWSAPVLVSGAAKEDLAPEIAIPEGGGAPMITWTAFQDDPTGVTFAHRRARMGTIAASGAIAFNANSFRLGPNTDAHELSVHNGMAGGAGKIYTVWADARRASSFNGTQFDIYFGAITDPAANADVSQTAALSVVSPKLGNAFVYTLTVNAGATPAQDVVSVVRFNRFWKVVSVVPTPGVTCWTVEATLSCILNNLPASGHATIAVQLVPFVKAGNLPIPSSTTSSSNDVNLANNTLSTPITIDGSEAQTANSSTGDVSLAIPDDSSTPLEPGVTVPPEAFSIVNLTLQMRVTHTYVNDLRVELVSPTGTTVRMKSENDQLGADFGTGATTCAGTQTKLDDTATARISSGTAPYAATFRPDGDLMAIMGQGITGTWKLRFTDTANPDAGTLHCATITFTAVPTPP